MCLSFQVVVFYDIRQELVNIVKTFACTLLLCKNEHLFFKFGSINKCYNYSPI